MNFQQELDSFLEDKFALELIQSFDTEFDIPFKHSQCIGLLEMLGAYEVVDQADDLKLAEYVGAWWCRIVRADVLYNILEGLEAIQASKNDANRLYQKVIASLLLVKNADQSKDESPNKQAQMMSYIAARWHDGAAKIYYRCNDHTEARLLFQKARTIAKQADLWYCLPDIQSNCLRVEYEELKAANPDSKNLRKDLKIQYEELRDKTLQTATRYHVEVPELDSAKHNHNLSYQEKQLLRGLSSIFHNFSVELQRENLLDDSLNASKKSEAICQLLKDGYRLAQVLNHQGQLALKMSGGRNLARQCFEKLNCLPWQRGKLIARQQLAKIESQEGLFHAAIQRITNLLDLIQENNDRRGGDLGFDSYFYYFTVQVFREILQKNTETIQIGQENVQGYHDRLIKEQLQMVRSIRKVVKIATYKTAFSRRFYGSYLELIANHVSKENYEDAFALIEEASSRELLDLLQSKNLSLSEELVNKLTPIDFSGIAKQFAIEPQLNRRSIRFLDSEVNNPELLSLLNELLNERRRFYENASLIQPIPTSEPNEDIAYEARIFTANHPSLVIVRYFFYDTPAQIKLAAYVFRDGELHFRSLNYQEIKEKLIDNWEKTWGNGSIIRGDGKRLYDLLIKPLWDLIVSENGLKNPNHLVIIPSGELFKLPLHVALVPKENISPKSELSIPLAAYIPTSFSVSATAYITRGRHLLRRQRVEGDDDLCVLMKRDEQVSGKELVGLAWSEKSFHIAGQPPEGVGSHKTYEKADRQGLDAIIKEKPEFFVYAGHGLYTKALESVGPVLELEGDCLTQFDIAMSVQLPRNKLTLLGACVSGQGANLGGGEIAGFIRAFIASGCGALGITLWPVLDNRISNTIRYLLSQAQKAGQENTAFDVVQETYEHYKDTCSKLDDPVDCMEACPLALYL